MFIKETEQLKFLEKIRMFSQFLFMVRKTIHLEKKLVILIMVSGTEHLIGNT